MAPNNRVIAESPENLATTYANEATTTPFVPDWEQTYPPYNITGLDGEVYQIIDYYWGFDDPLRYVPKAVCQKGPGERAINGHLDLYMADYKWDGLPFHMPMIENHASDEKYIALSMFLFGIVGMGLAVTSGYLARQNKQVTLIVSSAMMADALCRFVNSASRVYYGKCTLDWQCLKTDGYPYAGIMYNMIWSTIDYTAYLTMTLLQHWISVIRPFGIGIESPIKMKESAAKNEVNLRFATMLVATNLLIFGKQIVGSAANLVASWPDISYLSYSVYEFMHCSAISCITITFNMSYLNVKPVKPNSN
ncbi:unnamed protein product, partial [Mesorhabditis spiculigera]